MASAIRMSRHEHTTIDIRMLSNTIFEIRMMSLTHSTFQYRNSCGSTIRMSNAMWLNIRMSNAVWLNIRMSNIVCLVIRMSNLVCLDIRISNVECCLSRLSNVNCLAKCTQLIECKFIWNVSHTLPLPHAPWMPCSIKKSAQPNPLKTTEDESISISIWSFDRIFLFASCFLSTGSDTVLSRDALSEWIS